MRIPLATDIKTRTGAPDKDARIKNAYVETRGDQSVVRKRPIAQGGISVASVGSIAQGGISYTTPSGGSGVFFLNGDTQSSYTGDGTTWSAATDYSVGDHVTVNWEDYWALTDNTNQNPTTNPEDWSTEPVPPVPVVFDYATWNPFFKHSGALFSDDLLTITTANSTFIQGMGRASQFKSTGKWYWEVSVTSFGTIDAAQLSLGVADASAVTSLGLGYDVHGWARYMMYISTPTSVGKYHDSNLENYGSQVVNGDVFGFALNMDAGELTVYKNGVSEGVMYSGISSPVYPAYGFDSVFQPSVFNFTANFGASPFIHPAPNGYNPGIYT